MEALLLALSFIVLTLFIDSIRLGITPMPTGRRVKQELLRSFPEGKGRQIVELGSGWGTLALPLAAHCAHCQVIALERAWVPYLFSRIRGRRKNLSFHCKDFWRASLAEADIVLCYLSPRLMQRLEPKLRRELRPGALVISHTFALSHWQPYRVVHCVDIYRTPIYFYSLPLSDGKTNF